MKPLSMDGYKLLHDGVLAFADIESTGIRLDVKYLQEQYTKVGDALLNIEREMWRTKEAKEWKRKFGNKTKFTSPAQLSDMLFNQWGYKSTKKTKKGKESADVEVLRRIDSPFTRLLLRHNKLNTVKDTFISNLLNNQLDGFLHPSFNLHTVLSYRSSSNGPNFQNQPVRDPEQGTIIRTSFLPLIPEHQIGEIDYKGNEVNSNACYCNDPNLIAYIKDPTKDMHRDSAANAFLLQPEQIGKKIRYVGKNGFTFPEFYGSYYANIAPAMWWAIIKNKLVTKDGIPLRDHLRSKKINNLRQFTNHIAEVERHFWEVRFPTYAKWKIDWYEFYLQKGYFDLLSGFRCQGPMRKNEVTNYPGQGTGFHFVLWGMIQIHQWLTNENMESKVLGQIHDSIVFSFCPKELQIVLKKAEQIMCHDIRKHWKWINVPLSIDVEVSPPGKSWNDKQSVIIK